MFFDRDKVHMTVDVERDAYLPGETVRGTLRVRVLREVAVTALRLHVYAKEKVQVNSGGGGGGGSKEKGEDVFVHFDKLFTFFGYSKQSERKAGAVLAPSEPDESLEYPFEIALPYTTAPSFSLRLNKGGEISLTYKLRALAVIPNGFDGKVDKYIKVLTAMPRTQYVEMRSLIHGLRPYTMEYPDFGCCICLNRDSNPSVSVEASCPQLVSFDETGLAARDCLNDASLPLDPQSPYGPVADTPASPTGGGGATSPNHQKSVYFPVTLKVVNNSSKHTIPSIRLELKQSTILKYKDVSRTEVRTVASMTHLPPAGGIAPRQAYQTVLNLDIGARLSMFGVKNEKRSFATGGIVMPTMATRFVEVSNTLEISFPSLKTEEVAVVPDCCWLVSAIDPSSKTPPAPVWYNTPIILSEEVVGGAM